LLGKINCYKGDYLNSQNCLDEALKIYQQLNHHVGQIPVLGNLGMLYRLMGVYASAQPYLEQGLAMSQKLGQEELRMYGLEEMSRLYQARGDAQTAYEFARQALVLARRLGSPLGEWGGETCAGNALITLEDWDKAEQAHQAAWQRQQSLGHGGVGLENLAGLAQIALAQGKTSTALNKVEQILAWLNENDPAAVSLLLSIMWVCYRVLEANQDPRAINLLQTAYNELQRRAEAITETALRRSFLEDVVAHREILRAWSKVVPQIQQK
jgi:tetratricopeptide (TPR) repeat protein